MLFDWLIRPLRSKPRPDAAVVSTLLSGRCSGCGSSLTGHRYAAFASYILSHVQDRAHLSADVLRVGAKWLTDPVNNPDESIAYYAVLSCPNTKKNFLVEHLCEAGVYGGNHAEIVGLISDERFGEISATSLRWIEL